MLMKSDRDALCEVLTHFVNHRHEDCSRETVDFDQRFRGQEENVANHILEKWSDLVHLGHGFYDLKTEIWSDVHVFIRKDDQKTFLEIS